MTGLWVLLAAVGAAVVIGTVGRRRSGRVHAVLPAAEPGESQQLAARLAEAGWTFRETAPLILHFSAPWCGPCAGVRRVVAQLAVELPWVGHLEVDVARHPQLSSRLRVLSLPTVLIYDARLHQRFRVAGAPSVDDLRAVLLPLADGDDASATASG